MGKKNSFVAIIIVAVLVSAFGCGKNVWELQGNNQAETQLGNPWQDHQNIAEAEAAVGFEFNYSELVACEAFHAVEYRTMGQDMIEVIYETDQADDQLIIRQSPGEGQDISGDYTEFSHDYEDLFGQLSVRCRGTKDAIYVCTYSDKGYSYSISSGSGLIWDQVDEILRNDFK